MEKIVIKLNPTDYRRAFEYGNALREVVEKKFPGATIDWFASNKQTGHFEFLPPKKEEFRICRDCKHMVGGSDIPACEWQCDKRIDVVTGEFVSCEAERKSVAKGYPLTLGACGFDGANWEAVPQ